MTLTLDRKAELLSAARLFDGVDAVGMDRIAAVAVQRFDVDYLKIDGSFIRDLATDEGSRIFVRALNDVARGLDKQVIAEWVETPEVQTLLLGMGTQFGQGYLFQRPVPLERDAGPAFDRRAANAA